MADEINEKLEQIRIKNEELEKKHQEILQDELEAKKQGATVSKSQAVSCKTNEKHRYDNVELDYDVKDDQKEHAKNPDYKPKNRRPILGKKQLDEIPPDPVNFLRDTGDDQNNQVDPQAKRPQQQQNNRNRNNNNSNKNYRPRNNEDGEAGNKERSTDNQGPRQKNPNHRPRPHPNNNNYHNRSNDGSDQKQAVNNDNNSNSPRKTHPQQLRTERRAAPGHNSSMESSNSEQSPNEPNKGSPPKQPQQQQNRPKRPNNNDNNRPRPKPNKDRIEGKNDITVEVTDEVRSVKLKSSEKTFGTGRVRPSTESYENAEATNDNAQLTDAKKQHNKPRNHNHRKPKPKGPPQPEFQHPILDKIVITKTSVQDRLLRSKMMDEKDHQEPKVESESAQPAEQSTEN